MVKFDTFSELVNGAIIQEDAHLAQRRRKRERHRPWDLLAVLLRGSAWCSWARSEPPFSISRSSSGAIGPLSTHRHRAQLDLLFLNRLSRRFGCSSRGRAPICFHATTVGSLDTLHGTARCHQNRANRPVSRVRSSKWLISNRDKYTTPPSRVFQREL